MIKLLSSLDKGGNIVDLTFATADYPLAIGETATLAYTSATSVPLHVATVGGGEYEIIINGSITGYAANATALSFVGSSGAWVQSILYASGTTTVAHDQTGGTNSNASSHVADGLVHKAHINVSVTTGSINILVKSFGRAVSTFIANRTIDFNWLSSITSLGTITHTVAQSGKIIIRRIA